MKIDADLRTAIRSAERAQPSQDWQVKQRLQKEAIAELLKRKPSLDAKAKKAQQMKTKATKLNADAWALLKEIGVDDDLDSIRDEKLFLAHGGKVPSGPKMRWKFDVVMAELAGAEPEQERTILAKYGIKWE